MNFPLQKYPIGIQHFDIIRREGYVYVDKSPIFFPLVKNGGYYFLSRPRRFGKSLLLDSIACLYQGQKELFSGLFIYDKWDWDLQLPVLRISFSSIGVNTLGLEAAILKMLREKALEFGYQLVEDKVDTAFKELIQKLSSEKQVVILIDEYDKPITDFLDQPETVNTNRDILKSFYSVIKDQGNRIRLLFVTGVSKFSKVSIFSDLNNLNDLTLHTRYGSICGITQDELESVFSVELQHSNPEKIKLWYNGYTWDFKSKVYNPFSILNFFDDINQYKNYWFATGTPTFLIKTLRRHHQYDLSAIQVDPALLESFDPEHLNPAVLLFQTGYLTLDDFDEQFNLYRLKIPNQEVNLSLNSYLANAYREDAQSETLSLVADLYQIFAKNNPDGLKSVLNRLFATLPYDLWIKETEQFFHAIIHLTFTLLGIHVKSEVHTKAGRCDAVVETSDRVYVLEFKVDRKAEDALAQIIEKGYPHMFSSSGKTVIGIGINFSRKEKSVADMVWQSV